MLLSKIKNAYPNSQRSTCCENNCKLCISNKINYTILKGDSLVSSKKMCDCMIFRDDKKIILVELKTKRYNAYDVIEQLTNGGKEALSITSKLGGKNFSIHFLLVIKKRDRKGFAMDILRDRGVNINGKKYLIKRGKCQDPLERHVN